MTDENKNVLDGAKKVLIHLKIQDTLDTFGIIREGYHISFQVVFD